MNKKMKQKLEDKCRWKEGLKGQRIIEGRMKMCKECDGYKTDCYYYVPIKKIIYLK